MTFQHVPVMAREVVELLSVVPTGIVVDATVGGGGHARALLEARSDLGLLGIDRDREALEAAARTLAPFGERVVLTHGPFGELPTLVHAALTAGTTHDISTPDLFDKHRSDTHRFNDSRMGDDIVGIFFDLGVSSHQLDRAERGFSYHNEAPLDMRMDAAQDLTAERVVNEYPRDLLAEIIAANGEERFARRIAAAIVASRPLHTTTDLVDAVKAGIPARNRRTGRHPARRTFQAIRMEVNRELPNLAAGLDESVHLLAPGGRTVVLAYHSLEDRIVKDQFAQWSGTAPQPPGPPVVRPAPVTRLLTRRPRRASDEELEVNPRAASARLRAVEKLRAS